MKNDLKIPHDINIAIVTEDAPRLEAVQSVACEPEWRLIAPPHPAQPVDWIAQQSVQLVLVDLDVPNAVSLLAELDERMPHTPLLALASPQQMSALQDALLAGAKAFVSFPVDGSQFVNTVARMVNAHVEAPSVKTENESRTIAVTGLKGGAGRSTIAVNLAVALQQQGDADVILAETHQGLTDLAVMLNLHPRRTLANLVDEVEIDLDIIQGNLCRHLSGLQLLAAPLALEQLVEISPELWGTILDSLTSLAPTIVVDTGSMADATLSETLIRADEIVLVTSPDTMSLNNTRAMLQTLRNGQEVKGRVRLVVNRAGVRGGLNTATISKHLQEPVCMELVDDAPLATYAMNRGVPFVISHPRALLSRRIGDLAEQLQGTIVAVESSGRIAPDSSMFHMLRNRAAALSSLF